MATASFHPLSFADDTLWDAAEKLAERADAADRAARRCEDRARSIAGADPRGTDDAAEWLAAAREHTRAAALYLDAAALFRENGHPCLGGNHAACAEESLRDAARAAGVHASLTTTR